MKSSQQLHPDNPYLLDERVARMNVYCLLGRAVESCVDRNSATESGRLSESGGSPVTVRYESHVSRQRSCLICSDNRNYCMQMYPMQI